MPRVIALVYRTFFVLGSVYLASGFGLFLLFKGSSASILNILYSDYTTDLVASIYLLLSVFLTPSLIKSNLKAGDELIGSFIGITFLIYVLMKNGASTEANIICMMASIVLAIRASAVAYWSKNLNEKTSMIHLLPWMLAIMLALFLFRGAYRHDFGNLDFESFWSKYDFKATYIVEVSRNEGPRYTLPASIEFDSTRPNGAELEIRMVFFNNGGYLYFEDCYYESNNSCSCLDQRSEFWDIRILDHSGSASNPTK